MARRLKRQGRHRSPKVKDNSMSQRACRVFKKKNEHTVRDIATLESWILVLKRREKYGKNKRTAAIARIEAKKKEVEDYLMAKKTTAALRKATAPRAKKDNTQRMLEIVDMLLSGKEVEGFTLVPHEKAKLNPTVRIVATSDDIATLGDKALCIYS